MALRILNTYGGVGGTLLDVPPGCWVVGTTNYGDGIIHPALMAQIRHAAGETFSAPAPGRYIIKDLDEMPGAGGRYGKAWYVSEVNGRAICAYVDVDSSLNITSAEGLKAMFKSSPQSLWRAPYILAYGANDCTACIHASHFRGQVWWTQAPRVGGNYRADQAAGVYSTSNSGGANADWNAPKSIALATNPPAIQAQELGSGFLGQIRQSILPGPDGRTWAYTPNATLVNSDDAVGDKWDIGLNTVGTAYQREGNSFAGSPYNVRPNVIQGKSLAQLTILAGNQGTYSGCSDVVRSDDGTLYQLLFTNVYSRIRPVIQQPVPPSGERGTVPDTTIPPNVILNDPPNSATQMLHYTVAVPNDQNTVQFVRWTFLDQLFAHQPIKGVLNDKTKPTKITFAIPSWPDIPAYVQNRPPFNPTNNPYDGVSYFASAYVYCNFTFNSTPPGFYFTVGKKYDPKAGPNAKYLGDPPPAVYNPASFHSLQVSGSTPGYSNPIEGRGEYGFQPRPSPYLDGTNRQQMSFSRCFDCDFARGGTVTFDIQTFGNPGTMQWKDCYLAINYIDPINYNYQTHIVSETPGSLAPPLPLDNNAVVLDGESSAQTSYIPTYEPGQYYANPLMDEINRAQGQQYKFALRYIPGQNANGTPRRFYMTILDQFVQFSYKLANPDFFMVRSRDSGATWEFCADAKPIPGLAALRDYNNAYQAGLIPSLITQENNVYIVWVFGAKGQNGGASEGHPVKTLGSQDTGETWVLGNSFVPAPPR